MRLLQICLVLAILLGGLRITSPVYAQNLSSLFRGPASSLALEPIYSCNQPVRIMPLGDSITRGSSSGTLIDPQYYISYRRDLYKSLLARGYYVDFVGSQINDGSYYTDFDRDHEGWGGKNDEYIAQNIYAWLTNNPADIILLHIGTNDMSSTPPDTSATDVEQVLKEVDRFNPAIWVIVARIIQRMPYDTNTETFNNNVDKMLDARIQAGDKIIKVDMENEAGIVYAKYPAGDMNDDKHPYATGYSKMSLEWEAALQTLLPSCRCVTQSGRAGNYPAQQIVCQNLLFLPLIAKSIPP